MRMFLIGMTDIFLILYLTTISSTPPSSLLTVDDFIELKRMHEELTTEKKIEEEKLNALLLAAEKEKETLSSALDNEKDRTQEMEESLEARDAKLKKINQELAMKEKILKERDTLLTDLNKRIETKEELWQKKEASYSEKLQNQKKSLEAHQQEVKKLEAEAEHAKQLASTMQEEAALAHQTAKKAQEIQEKALQLKDQVLKEKKEAEHTVELMVAARKRAEAEKENALKIAEEAETKRRHAEALAEKMAQVVEGMRQDCDVAYREEVAPHIQELIVTYTVETTNQERVVHKRRLTLFPVEIGGEVYVIAPARHVGFRGTGDSILPGDLEIVRQGELLTKILINKEKELVAIQLSGYTGTRQSPHEAGEDITHLMPVLLALRNNAYKSLFDAIRRLSDEYFVVTRDYLEGNDDGSLTYEVSGFRGTGTYGERIVRGDQLVDLNGRFIGVADETNHIIRIDSLDGWKEKEL